MEKKEMSGETVFRLFSHLLIKNKKTIAWGGGNIEKLLSEQDEEIA